MKRHAYLQAAAFALLLASCVDRPTAIDSSGELPSDLPQPALGVLDGTQEGGNEHFFWLPPLGDGKSGFEGVADPTQLPAVEVCLLDSSTEDGCVEGQPLAARFTRTSGLDQNRIKVDDKDEYFVHWRMNDFPAQAGGQYRIRVMIQDTELGYADVVTLRQNQIKTYSGDLIAISDNGALKIAFRIEEGALCSEGALACTTATEIPGDGQPTVVQVPAQTVGGDQVVAAVVTVNDAVFEDENGDPIPEVTVSASVRIDPPSDDIFVDDALEIPFFVEIKTFPSDVYIDPNGPGVVVVICQDEAELDNRNIPSPLHPQLILYKVSEANTKRLVSTFGAPECSTALPAPSPGVMGMLKRGAASVLGIFGPQPLVARRRLHGGLNTVVKRGADDGSAFSTFGAALGPNAAQTQAVFPANGEVGTAVPITIQVKDALGQDFLLAGDTLDVTVSSGPNAGAAVTVTDVGSGLYTASYTPTAPGTDVIDIVLIRNDGVGLGPIGGSPYSLVVYGPSEVTNTNDAGPGSLRQAILNTNARPGRDSISFAIPAAGEQTIALSSPLPTITEAVVVDGKSQGFDGSPFVRIDGAGVTGYGFDVQAGDVTIRAVSITGFSADGIFVLQASSNVILEDNHIGTDRAGSAGLGNQDNGIRYRGGNGAIRRNLISGNAKNGILMELASTSSNVIEDNVIGLDAAGTAVLPNGWSGVTMYDGTPNNVIRNNVISGNDQQGIDIQHSGALAPVSGTQILGNVIGLDVNGNLLNRGGGDVIDTYSSFNWGPYDRGNLRSGIRLINTVNTVVGAPGQGNVVSGNTRNGIEVDLSATGVTIRANFIGTDAAGTALLGNGTRDYDGVRVAGNVPSGVVIGGSGSGDGNVISGNLSDGIGIQDGTSAVTVMGNLVGTDPSGTSALPNGNVFTSPDQQGCCHSGIFVGNATNVVIGGATPGAANLVSGNNTGMWIGSAPGIHIEGNNVGLARTGPGFVPNTGDGGIALYGTQNAVIKNNVISGNQNWGGGIFIADWNYGPPSGNLIQGNTFNGNTSTAIVETGSGSGNTFRGNSMSGNAFGIDLGWDGPTANDPLDADAGPNDLVNYPELLAAFNGAVVGSTVVDVRLNGAPATAYTVEFFSSASGSAEGEVPLLVTTAPITDGAGQAMFSINVPAEALGRVITATATDANGSTSEFSPGATVQSLPAGVFYWSPSGGGNGHFYQYVTGNQTWLQAKSDAEGMSVLGRAGHLVTITSPEEQAFVNGLTTPLGLLDWRPWIGLRDVSGTGTWAWVTGEPFVYTNWGGGEPNNIGSELYVEMFFSGVWNNNTDSAISPFGYLVEYPPS